MAGAMMVFNAAAADAPKELNLGILGGQNATQQIKITSAGEAVSGEEPNVGYQLRNSSDYSGVIQGLLGGKIDLVLSMSLPSFASAYIMIRKRWTSSARSGRRRPVARLLHWQVVKAGSPWPRNWKT